MARQAVNDNQLAQAQTYLQWVIDKAESPSLREVARLRLSRVLAAQQQYAAALQVLTVTDDEAYQGLAQETRGDIFKAQGNLAQAKQAYQQALDALPKEATGRMLLTMKWQNVN